MVGSQGVIRERPAEAFRPKQITIWVCEAKALYWLAYDKKDSYTIATQLSLSQILLGAISKQSGAPRNWERGASESPERGRHRSGLGEDGSSNHCS